MKRREVRARVLTVRMPLSEVGFFNSLIDGLDRLALTRTRKKGEGLVDVIAPPYRFDELIKAVEGMKKHVEGLEILGESELKDLDF
jgi:hypothetical protein